jgi:hypothetical protein
MMRKGHAVLCQAVVAALALSTASGQDQLKVRVSWGHTSPEATPFDVRLFAVQVNPFDVRGLGLEKLDQGGIGSITRSGGGDVDGIEFTVEFRPREIRPNEKVHHFWSFYFAQCDGETARRLKQDPAYRPDLRVLTVQTDPLGTRGFSLTVDQLLANKAFWVPSLDVYVAVGDNAPSFEEHRRQLDAYKGMRVLEQAQREPEATYELYASRWEDMGSPLYKHPSQPAPGHIVCLTWDSALHKFGIDRWAGVWNDYGNPDRFRFRFDFGERGEGVPPLRREAILASSHQPAARTPDKEQGGDALATSQRLQDGLPIITTTGEQEGLRYEVEQFAYPLNGPPAQRRGDIPMVLLQKVTVTSLGDHDGPVSVKVHHRREYPAGDTSKLAWKAEGDAVVFEESAAGRVLFALEGRALTVASCETRDETADKRLWKASEVVLTFDLPRGASKEFVVKLPSPPVEARDCAILAKLDYGSARDATLRFWEDWVRRGAQFSVPEKAVNDLYRASLWHALRLPRRHGGQEEGVQIDLPYSNFAYDQRGTPWPINQAVYVDYMIYALRGYHDVAAEEMLAMYRNNQEPSGHVKGYANWGVYTPSMVYVTAKNYLLSGDRETFERLLPQTLRALDWCLAEVRDASRNEGRGLIRSPLNDLTGDGVWAFTQAYVYAALDMMGRALEQAGHPRAWECSEAAGAFRKSIEDAFGGAAMWSPLVQLRDRTWTPYVPCEVEVPGRRLEQWYPTDVDTGAMHLLRLKALPAHGVLADALLNDHEDNLYLHGWGMANEPVYNPQATAYLLRDEPKAVIRAFYSYMACAFSHSVLEPVEHRWTWGQYFGPPSTDGAWFELYRNMLIHELDDGSLLLMQATPRKWLADGQRIAVERAPTYYGDMSMIVESHAASGTLAARIEMPKRLAPERLIVRFRHPEAKPIQSLTVNSRDWTGFDTQKEWVVVEKPVEGRYNIEARY